MKNVILKIFAILLTVWYSMSIIGFNVHTCSGSGRSFVVTFIDGVTCEDIHPDHVCSKVSCCSDRYHDHCACGGHDGVSFGPQSCCSSDYQVLALTGTLSQNDHEHFDECACGSCPCVGFAVCGAPLLPDEYNFIAYIHAPDPGVASACERQASLSVWRI